MKQNELTRQPDLHAAPIVWRVLRVWALLGLASFAATGLSLSAATSRRGRAQPAYDDAVSLREALESRPEPLRARADYERLIRAYQAVYRINPAYRKTPAALAAVGELYREMGREFSEDADYERSIKAYEFLAAQYPHSSLARDALLIIGEIYDTDLGRPEDARQVYQRFLEQYPKSTKVVAAQLALKQIDEAQAKRAAAEAASRQPLQPVPRSGQLLLVNGIRRWVGPDYTRIVIGVEDEVPFNAQRVANPDRLVFDLSNTRLSPALVGKTFAVEDGFLRQIRVGQYRPTVTRVVLDVEQIGDYSVFSLPNPFRLVIDIHGKPKAMAAKSSNSTGPQTGAAAGARSKGAAGTLLSLDLPEAAEDASSNSAASAHRSLSNRPDSDDADSDAASSTVGAGPGGAAPVAELGGTKTAPSTVRVVESPAKPSSPTEGGSRTLTRALGLKIARIVIDPGHGGHDTGTIGPSGLREKDVVLDVGLRLKKLIETKTGSEVVMTRSNDTFIPLEERTAIANEKDADLFISIHANASRDRSARGIETYYLNFTSDPHALEVAARENATSQESVHRLQQLIEKIALTEKIEESRELSRQIQRSVYEQIAQSSSQERDRGLKKAPFVVLIGANMPSILSEISFLTNPRDESLLKRASYRQKIAEALYRGIARYVNNLGGVKVAQESAVSFGKPPHPAARGKPSSASRSSPAGTPDF